MTEHTAFTLIVTDEMRTAALLLAQRYDTKARNQGKTAQLPNLFQRPPTPEIENGSGISSSPHLRGQDALSEARQHLKTIAASVNRALLDTIAVRTTRDMSFHTALNALVQSIASEHHLLMPHEGRYYGAQLGRDVA